MINIKKNRTELLSQIITKKVHTFCFKAKQLKKQNTFLQLTFKGTYLSHNSINKRHKY